MGDEKKDVPRWAASKDALEKVIKHQRKDCGHKIFGQVKPKYVQEQFVTSKIFSKGEDARSYLDARDSSGDWND